METKEIVEKLRYFAEYRLCHSEISVAKEAADRLEELEKKNAKLKAENDTRKLFCETKDEINKDLYRSLISMEQKLSEKQPEWISVEDERKPDDGETCIVMSSTNCIYSRKYEKGGFPKSDRIRYWMHKPALPKPKEQTFKDVFLEKFPKAPVDKDGIPKACIANVFPWAKHENCDGWECFEDWNQSYFELKEEGEGDADNSK